MPKCCLCPNTRVAGGHITFFRFPEDETRRKQWIKACKKPVDFIPKHHHLICRLHFTDDDILTTDLNYRPRLKTSAVPSIIDLSHKNIEFQTLKNTIPKPSKSQKSTEKNIKESKKTNFDKIIVKKKRIRETKLELIQKIDSLTRQLRLAKNKISKLNKEKSQLLQNNVTNGSINVNKKKNNSLEKHVNGVSSKIVKNSYSKETKEKIKSKDTNKKNKYVFRLSFPSKKDKDADKTV